MPFLGSKVLILVSKIDHFHVTEVGLKIMCFFKGSNLSGRTNWFAANAFSMEEACSIVHYMHTFFLGKSFEFLISIPVFTTLEIYLDYAQSDMFSPLRIH